MTSGQSNIDIESECGSPCEQQDSGSVEKPPTKLRRTKVEKRKHISSTDIESDEAFEDTTYPGKQLILDEMTIQSLIDKAVAAAVIQLRQDLTEILQAKVTPLQKRIEEIESENTKLKSKELVNMRQLVEDTKSDLNDLQQYSRKSNVHIFGVPEESNENCKTKAMDIIKHSLKLPLTDDGIEVAHRAGKRVTRSHGVF